MRFSDDHCARKLVKRTWFRLQRLAGRRPGLYYTAYRLAGHNRHLAVNRNTELVIEGFPRSGNTFAVVAFEQAQDHPVRIAHHLHVSAQIIAGVRMGIPVMLLLRNPEDAICSLVIREPHLSLDDALWDYIGFHRSVLPWRSGFVVAGFDEVTSDFGTIIARINARFSTTYNVFVHTQSNVDRVFTDLDGLEAGVASKTADERRVARPSEERRKLGEALQAELRSDRYGNRLELAHYIHARIATPAAI